MDRRRLILSAIFGLAPTPKGLAQTRTIKRIGVLWHATPEEEVIFADPIRKGLADFGYIEGKHYELIETYAAEQYERFAINAAKLVESRVDIIVAVTSPAAAAAQRATETVPIVFLLVPNPVERGSARSLSRPGGNLTGQSTVSVDLSSKRIEYLQALVPNCRRVILFVNAKDAALSHSVANQTRAAGILTNVTVDVIEIKDPEDLDGALAAAARNDIRGAIFMQDPLFFNERKRIARLAIFHGVATMVATSVMVKDGCLISYGANSAAQFRRVGAFVDKILKGDKPGDIPIEQPTRIELVLNMKTAAALGLDVPDAFIAQVDEIID
ncbi:ABC transporter substrate-binding protein [Methylobacterium isbiliense]|uniref:ABC transporter substrate-binding protein n=2 Tax=Methylobacterium isbiliense TaxID=315478 RepID=A0ABQ4SID1_9HYPH|nr:ABC transporter substrate-binding protein [Methylobacterium isbiliense]GJE02188.1 hypothetical protein GMJLKIPL_4132 [Methylobacterium isbiliense]